MLHPAPFRLGPPANGDGIALGSGSVTVDAFIDFLCPFCKMFEEQNGEAIDEMVDQGLVTLVHHPLGFLDRLSTTRYSTRAVAASAARPTEVVSASTYTRSTTTSPRRAAPA